VNEGEYWRTRPSNETKDILRGEYVKFIKSFWPRWYGLVERIYKQRKPKQMAKAAMEETMNRGRRRKMWGQEAEENLNI
jgi:hypothetical protein